MVGLGERFEEGVQAMIDSRELPWHVTRIGCRVEYLFRADEAKNGAQAAAGQDEELDTLDPPLHAEPRHPHDPVPQHVLMSPATPLPRTWTGTPRSSRTADELVPGLGARPRLV